MKKRNEKVRVAMAANDLNINGISTVIINYCSNMNLSDFDLTILAGRPVSDYYKEICSDLGIHIIELPERKANPANYYRSLGSKLSENHYDIFHVHGNSATITIELFLAWLHRIPVRIAHSHNTTCSNKKAHKLLLPFFNRFYTHGFACSDAAGKWLFGGKKFVVLPNGFHTGKFQFDEEKRKRIRQELTIEDKFVIGHVGRFNAQKNHLFLLEIFEHIAEKKQNAVLVLVGDGPDIEKVRSKIAVHPYKERIILYGETSETEAVYAAMDVFVFPSRFEGLGIVLLEAQMNGLACVASDVVPHEVSLGNQIHFLPLEKGASYWADTILSIEENFEARKEFFCRNRKQIGNYEIRENAKYLEELYRSYLQEKNHGKRNKK